MFKIFVIWFPVESVYDFHRWIGIVQQRVYCYIFIKLLTVSHRFFVKSKYKFMFYKMLLKIFVVIDQSFDFSWNS